MILLAKKTVVGPGVSDLLLVPLFIAPFLTFLPLGIHPRVASLFWVAFAFTVTLTLARSTDWKRVPIWVPFGIAAYGAIIAPEWLPAVMGDVSRRAGGFDWFVWGLLALLLLRVLRNRWEGVLWGFALVGATMGVLALFGDTMNGRAVGITANPGILGFWGMVGIISAMGLLKIQSGISKWWMIDLALMSSAAILLSETRAAFLGLALALPLLDKRWLLASVPFLLLVFGFAHPGADAQRLSMWRFVLLPENLSLVGHGWGTFREAYTESVQDFPHSVPLQLFWSLGLVGVAMVGTFLYVGFWNLRGPWLALFVGFSVYSLFWFPSPPWFFVGAVLIARMRKGTA